MHFCLNFSCLSMNVFDMHGISVAESIVSWCAQYCPLQEHRGSELLWMGNVSSRRKHQVQLVENASRDLKKIIIFRLVQVFLLSLVLATSNSSSR